MQIDPTSPFASVINLGPLKTEHSYKGLGKWVGLIFGVLCLLAGPVLGLLALFLGFDAYSREGLGRAGDAARLSLCLAGGALVVGALIVYNVWRNWPLRAAAPQERLRLTPPLRKPHRSPGPDLFSNVRLRRG